MQPRETPADTLVERAHAAQTGQAALLDATPLSTHYSAAFSVHVEAKHAQVGRLEDRLESMIENQSSRLQQVQMQQPGMFALPSTKAKWQERMQQGQATMQRLHERLEAVREIKDAMGVHGSHIEELATRKLRAQEPELAAGWDEMRDVQRCAQAHQRLQDREAKQNVSRGHALPGRGIRLSLSQI